ncbi:MAG TPA: 50S ribosomal protein L24 [Candidatus Methanomethylophilaceae archaeon]|nr:MAG: 50S ribosomal protein L24P [Thermoplasmatales archaeon 49_6]MDI3541661.1 large subunit ribosomal protein [Candidatus Methanomethylophilaceae archaeon]HIJ00413.1 50S ribosomal protein L24 [Candidatus Methanomethylophilaceae archaeon]
MVKSSKARKQRKAYFNAPNHARRRSVASPLSPELKEKYGKRTMPVVVGDTVVVLRGNEDVRGIEGKVLEVITKTGRLNVEGVTINQADGTEVSAPVHASNVMITKLELSDEWRKDKLLRKNEVAQ